MRRVGVVLLAAALMPLASCAPAGAAIGDSGSGEPDVQSTGVERNDVSIGMVGSHGASADGLVLDAYDHAGLAASYVRLCDSADPVEAGQRAVRDLVSRQVAGIVISGLDVSRDAVGWNDALNSVRTAGIPVILLNPVHEPGMRACTRRRSRSTTVPRMPCRSTKRPCWWSTTARMNGI